MGLSFKAGQFDDNEASRAASPEIPDKRLSGIEDSPQMLSRDNLLRDSKLQMVEEGPNNSPEKNLFDKILVETKQEQQ